MTKCYSCPEEPVKLVKWGPYVVPYCEGCCDGVCQQLSDEGVKFTEEDVAHG